MLPADLKASSFASYPPQGRKLAESQLALLQELPLVLVPILLREVAFYDWKFPAERFEIDRQFQFLSALSATQRSAAMEQFRALSLSPELTRTDWVSDPSGFMEKLTASLWSTHQMDRFRDIADTYERAVEASLPTPAPSMPRLGVVIIGAGVETPPASLFKKLRPYGVHLTRIDPQNGTALLLREGERRASLSSAKAHAEGVAAQNYLHWYIDGGAPTTTEHLTRVSYDGLEPSRVHLLHRIQSAIATGTMGPEELRSLLARTKPVDIGLGGEKSDPILDHFQLTLLTEGAGTQIFATTFAQWAARECARRAQPETLIVRYAPRQQAQTMNAMLTGARLTALDPAGSLVDADMGAFYTWINMRRLTGADKLRFIVWFEGHSEAMIVGPDLPRGTTSDSHLDMEHLISLAVS